MQLRPKHHLVEIQSKDGFKKASEGAGETHGGPRRAVGKVRWLCCRTAKSPPSFYNWTGRHSWVVRWSQRRNPWFGHLALWGMVSWCGVLWFSIVWYCIAWYGMMVNLCGMVLYGIERYVMSLYEIVLILMYGLVLYNFVWYSNVQYWRALLVVLHCTLYSNVQYCLVLYSWSVGGGGRVIRGNHWSLATPILVTL